MGKDINKNSMKNTGTLKSIKSESFTNTVNKYTRGSLKDLKINKIKFKGLKKTIKETAESIKNAAEKTAAAEVLLPSEQGFIELDDDAKTTKIYKIKQKEIIQNVDLNTAKNVIDLQLTKFGPYTTDYTRNGRYNNSYYIIIVIIIIIITFT